MVSQLMKRRLLLVEVVPHGTVAAELLVVALVVTPEAAPHARVSTSLSIETSPPTLSSQLSSQASNLTNARVFRMYQEDYIVCRQEEGRVYRVLR